MIKLLIAMLFVFFFSAVVVLAQSVIPADPLPFVKNPLLHGTLVGLLGGAAVDIHAAWSSPDWHIAGFNWKTASKRWIIGAVAGFLGAAGLGWIIA